MTLQALETASTITLPDEQVAVCGDWHGNIPWLRMLAPALATLAPDVKTVLQLGDWWMDITESDRIFTDAGIERVYVTLGNHEPWDQITPLLNTHPDQAVRVSEVTWLLPRPGRLNIGGREILSLGGAASVDRLARTEGVDWWPDEAITQHQADMAIDGGYADIMLTHESPQRTPVRAVREILASNPHGFPERPLIESARSRWYITRVADPLQPKLLMHGHMHVADGGTDNLGIRVESLGCDFQEGHLAILNLNTLEYEFPTLDQIRSFGGCR
jgi:hypothetical protein